MATFYPLPLAVYTPASGARVKTGATQSLAYAKVSLIKKSESHIPATLYWCKIIPPQSNNQSAVGEHGIY